MHADSRPEPAESPRYGEPESSAALTRAEAEFAAAKELCRTGHRDDEGTTCTYGGMAAANGYWLAFPDCELNHGELCDLRAVCDGAPAETGFHGREGTALVDDWIWRVTACQPCADLYVAAHPEWVRKPAPEPLSYEERMRRLNELVEAELGAMTPQQRAVMDMLTNLALYGQHPAPEGPPWFTGLLNLDDPVQLRYAAKAKRTFPPAPHRAPGEIGNLQGPLYITPPEATPGSWTGPTSFLPIEDEAGPWPTHTLTHDPQQPLTRAAALVADLAHVNGLLASCFAAPGAWEAHARFLRQTHELTTSPGVSASELEALRNGLRDLAEGRTPPPPAAEPAADAGPFTHTFTFSPRKSGKSEALRKTRAQAAPKAATPQSDPNQVPFVMIFPDNADRAEGPGREFKLRDLFGDEELKSLPYSSGTVVCAPNSVYAVLFEQLPEKERREFVKTAMSLASLGGDELSITEIIRNLLVIARGYGARGKS